MTKTFSDAFREHLDRTGLKVADVSSASGVRADALYKLNKGKTQNMHVDDAVKVAAVFGETVEQFLGVGPAKIQSELDQEIAKLTDQERQILLASIRALVVSRDQTTP